MIPLGFLAAVPRGGGGPPAAAYYAAVMEDSPAAYWRLKETTGSVVANSVPGGVDGSYGGYPTRGEPSLCGDAGDYSMTFPGTTGVYLNFGTPASLKFNKNFTYEAIIVAPPPGTARTIISYGSGGFAFTVFTNNRLRAVKSQVVGRGESSIVLAQGVRYHVAATVNDLGELRFWVNGEDAGAGTTASDYGSPESLLAISSDFYYGTSAASWIGPLDEVAIYATALTQARIRAHAIAAGLASE